jgi:hypothetical protein
MRYYAYRLKGDPFTITDPTAVLDHLKEHEEDSHPGCRPVASYRDQKTDKDALVAILEDYGFSVVTPSPSIIRVWDFEYHDIGDSWDYFWEAFARGTTDEVSWVMRSEDGDLWAEVITTDGHRTADVTVNYTVGD